MDYPELKRLIEIVEILRSENGCQWDREQTHATLKRNMLEEAYEAVDAINDNDLKHLQEELGDVLLQVVLHAQIAKEEKRAAYTIISNKGLVSLATYHPTTKEEFISLYGLGEITYQSFGIRFINAIKAFTANKHES